MKTHYRTTSRHKQRGIVAIIMTIAMLAILSVTALAVDVNHMYMNRTKLQNGVDAAALAAAVVLDNSGSEDDAKTAVSDTLTKLVSTDGNSELDLNSASISVTFNSTSTFDGGECYAVSGLEDCYVRVVVNNMDLQSFFMQMFSDTKQIAASAVAGPSAGANTICNVTPMTVCAADTDDTIHGGYEDGKVYPLKTIKPDDCKNKSSPTYEADCIGAGNFHLIQLDPPPDSSKKEDTHLREQLAGGYKGCKSIDEELSTLPGNKIGPVDQGINSRFGDKSGAIDNELYISDLNTTPNIAYSEYIAGDHNNRRMLTVPIIDCSSPEEDHGGGVMDFKIVSFGCFFLRNEAAPNAGKGQVGLDGEYVSDCSISNAFNNGQSSRNGPYRIVLYKDPLNEDS